MSSEIPQWSVDVVRRKFIEYFETKRDHVNYLSSPCVPVNDPTLLFTNAGMNQVRLDYIPQLPTCLQYSYRCIS
jgi:alanyl-tRNA synthetase